MPISNPAAVSVPTLISYKSADQTVNNSATPVDVAEMVITVEANQKYEFFFYVKNRATATVVIRALVTVPAGGSLLAIINGDIGGSSGVEPMIESDFTNYRGIAGKAADRLATFRGLYIGGANAGNVQFQFAQETAEASDTKILAGSYIEARKLA